MQTVRRAAVARGTTTLNILQQTGASIGTAVLSVVLASALTSELGGHGGHGGLNGVAQLPPAVHQHVAPLMANAFGHTFWWAVGLLGVAFATSLVLPKRRPEPAAGEAQPAPIPA
jgi:hypothetical protein